MRQRERTSLLACLVGLFLLSYPLLNLPNQATLVFGIPLLYLYLFVLWVVGVFVAWLLSRGREA